MSEEKSDFEAMERELTDLSARAAELKRELRQGRVKDLEARGERLIVRPVMVAQPGHGERDPWFGLSSWDWRKFRQEGFEGWMETTAGSHTPKVMILVDRAIEFLEARCRKQAETRRKAGGLGVQA